MLKKLIPEKRNILLYSIELGNQMHFDHNEFICIEPIDLGNIHLINQIRDHKIKDFKKLLFHKQKGIIAFYKNQPAGHAWMITNDCPVKDSIPFVLDKNQSMIHYCYVSPEFRGKNIYPLMLSYLNKKAFNQLNNQKVFIWTDISNIASQKGIEKAGFVNKAFYKVFYFLSFPLKKIKLD